MTSKFDQSSLEFMQDSSVYLPEEIILKIFTQLPVKYIGRCRCLSKQWRTIISKPEFIRTLHSIHSSSRPKAIFLENGSFFTVDFNGSGKNSVSYYAAELRKKEINNWKGILSSCDGLVLALDNLRQLFLLNPTTLECKKLPNPCVNPLYLNYPSVRVGLGYDSTSDDYKVVIFSFPYTNAFVYTSQKNYWMEVQALRFLLDCCIFRGEAVSCNGSLHWFATTDTSFLIAYDLARGKFRVEPLPDGLSNYSEGRLNLTSFGLVGGSLCIILDPPKYDYDVGVTVWVMKEYGVMESWIKFSIRQDNVRSFDHVFFLGNNEFAMFKKEFDVAKAVVYNASEKSTRDVIIHGLPYHLKLGLRMCCTCTDSLISIK